MNNREPELDTVAIRARPPSPRRLSRKVLFAGALAMGAVVALALTFGLSDTSGRRPAAEAEASAVAGPPDTIRLAPPAYDAASMEAAGGGDGAQLEAPADMGWSGAPDAPAAASTAPRADPQAPARSSNILFASAARPSVPARDAGRLEASLRPPRSPYELMAGSVIAAALITELNSDRPGRAIAQVTAPVYDSVRGEHLLIPQGSRLIGAYDSQTNYGDRRLVLVWQRLILPNGWSTPLDDMEAAGPSGAAGLSDRTDNHPGRLGVAIALSAIISVVANEAEDDEEEGLARSVGDAAAQEAARTGGRIVDRELSVRPTLRVRAGAPVRVLVTRDIRLRPYRP